MKKLLILWISIFFINVSSAQKYIEPLKKLNTFLETFEKGYYGPFEVVDGFLIYNSEHNTTYYKKEMKLLSSTFVKNRSVLFKCTDKKKWYNNKYGNDYYELAIHIISIDDSLYALPALINDFINAYNQEFNFSNAVQNSTTQNKNKNFGNFSGSVIDGNKTGFGKYTTASGDIVEGKFENNFLNGKGVITYINGDVYKGEIKDNLASGQGKTIYQIKKYENSTHTGSYLDGKPNGEGEISGNSYGKKISYKGNFKDGKYSGYGIWQSVNVSGNVGYRVKRTENYEGNWELGYYHGTGTLTTKNSLNSSPATITGEWYVGNVSNVKAYNEEGDLLFAGGKKEESSFYKKMGIERDEKIALEQAEREKKPTVCVCPKCKGTGEVWAKQLETVEIDNGTDKYGNKKTIKENVYTNQFFSLCSKCLGDGKCH